MSKHYSFPVFQARTGESRGCRSE